MGFFLNKMPRIFELFQIFRSLLSVGIVNCRFVEPISFAPVHICCWHDPNLRIGINIFKRFVKEKYEQQITPFFQTAFFNSPFATAACGFNADGFELPRAGANNDVNAFFITECERWLMPQSEKPLHNEELPCHSSRVSRFSFCPWMLTASRYFCVVCHTFSFLHGWKEKARTCAPVEGTAKRLDRNTQAAPRDGRWLGWLYLAEKFAVFLLPSDHAKRDFNGSEPCRMDVSQTRKQSEWKTLTHSGYLLQ
jgi:hypothetical protein